MSKKDLTKGSVLGNLLRFSLPFLLSCFLQTFYGLADLFITGQYNGSSTITAVSVGSQIMHMLTVIIVGLSMGTTVSLGHLWGSGKRDKCGKVVGNTVVLFSIFSVVLTGILLACTNYITKILLVPPEALAETKQYVYVCFAGVLFITAYNVLSSIYRGVGDSKHPMIFVMIAGVLNIGLDYLFIGPLRLGAIGAAIATVVAQAISVVLAIIFLPKTIDIKVKWSDFIPSGKVLSKLIKNGAPIALQDGLIQVSFIIITIIANSRGVEIAAAVGIVEKIICFLFLIPSAMLSSVSTLCAQNIGAGNVKRSQKTLMYALIISVASGIIFSLICNLFTESIITPFAKTEPLVVAFGMEYLRSYVFDCIFAGMHFCFSGYFCANEKPVLSFIHNIISIIVARIPLVYLASVLWPDTLFPMGLGAPIGSLLSAIICIFMYFYITNKDKKAAS